MSEVKDDIQFTQADCQVIKRDVVYKGVFCMAKYYLKHKLYDQSWSKPFTREMMERLCAAGVLPYDPITNQVVLIEQFRVGALNTPSSPWLIEIVAGIFDKDESPEDLVLREALEEAGCNIKRLHPIYEYFVSPGGSNEHIKLFIGEVDATHVEGIYGVAEENENIRAFTVSLPEALIMVEEGKVNTSPAIISLLWLQHNRERLLTLWQAKIK